METKTPAPLFTPQEIALQQQGTQEFTQALEKETPSPLEDYLKKVNELPSKTLALSADRGKELFTSFHVYDQICIIAYLKTQES